MNIHWKDWCWSSNTVATWSKELTHWKRPWCWERSKAREGDDRGWDGWMASPTPWTWVWASSGSWWWTRKPGVLQSTESQRVGHDWATELTWGTKEPEVGREPKESGVLENVLQAGSSFLKWQKKSFLGPYASNCVTFLQHFFQKLTENIFQDSHLAATGPNLSTNIFCLTSSDFVLKYWIWKPLCWLYALQLTKGLEVLFKVGICSWYYKHLWQWYQTHTHPTWWLLYLNFSSAIMWKL